MQDLFSTEKNGSLKYFNRDFALHQNYIIQFLISSISANKYYRFHFATDT